MCNRKKMRTHGRSPARVRGHVCAILEGGRNGRRGCPALRPGREKAAHRRRLPLELFLSWLVGSKVDIASRGSGGGLSEISRSFVYSLQANCKQLLLDISSPMWYALAVEGQGRKRPRPLASSNLPHWAPAKALCILHKAIQQNCYYTIVKQTFVYIKCPENDTFKCPENSPFLRLLCIAF